MGRGIPSLLLSFALLFSGGVLSQDDAAEDAAAEEEGAGQAFTLDREGERCITTQSIRETDIIDERTIVFRMRGGDYYVNNLSYRCRGLVREDRFSYRVTAGRLCNVDTIRVIEQFGGRIQEGIGCGLGLFYPITEEEVELMSVEARERRGGPQIEVENPNEGEDQGDDEAEESGSADPEGKSDDATAL